MAPADPAGKFAVIALPEFIKYPSPFTAVKVDVFGVVCQLTEPLRPKPDWVAPEPKVTAVPQPPKVSVEPDALSIVFPSILLIY